MRNYCVIIAKS